MGVPYETLKYINMVIYCIHINKYFMHLVGSSGEDIRTVIKLCEKIPPPLLRPKYIGTKVYRIL